MKRGPWFSSYISIACNLVAFLLTLYIPETMNIMNPQNRSSENNNATAEDLPTQSIAKFTTLFKSSFLSSARHGIKSLRIIVWDNKRLSVVLFSTLFTRSGSYTNVLLMQYIAKRYSMKWSEVSSALFQLYKGIAY